MNATPHDYIELASSSDKTCAFFAALRARVQSPTLAASRASAIKLRTLEAKSDCVAFRFRPRVAPILRSATFRLSFICCWAALASAGVNCGAICGTSGLFAESFVVGDPAGKRGRAGVLRTATKGDGGGETSQERSGASSIS